MLWIGSQKAKSEYICASMVTQLLKNLPAMQETWVQFLGWEDPLEKGTAIHSSTLAWRFHGLYSPWGHKELDMTEQLSFSLSIKYLRREDGNKMFCRIKNEKVFLVLRCEI